MTTNARTIYRAGDVYRDMTQQKPPQKKLSNRPVKVFLCCNVETRIWKNEGEWPDYSPEQFRVDQVRAYPDRNGETTKFAKSLTYMDLKAAMHGLSLAEQWIRMTERRRTRRWWRFWE